MTKATASFTEEEFKLLEFAVYTAIRQGYHEGVGQEYLNNLSELRYKLLSCVSEATYHAVSWSVKAGDQVQTLVQLLQHITCCFKPTYSTNAYILSDILTLYG